MKKEQTKEKKTSSVWQSVWKVLKIIIKILRWPVVYYGALVGGFYGITSLIFAMQNEPTTLVNVVGEYGIVIGVALAVVMLITSILTSAFFTETFLVSTGLACGMYLIASLFITAPYTWGNDYVEFDAMKMYVFLALALVVLIGDIIAFVFRKILRKRSVRHMMKQT